MERAEDSGQADVDDSYLYGLFTEYNTDIKLHRDTFPRSSLLIHIAPPLGSHLPYFVSSVSIYHFYTEISS